MGRRTLIAAISLLSALMAWGQEPGDTTLNISEVVVTSKLTFREVIPSQKLNGEQLQRLSSLTVADAMRYFAGVQLKDYGGVGGVKTVDVRSMGTNHLGVSYDGLTLGNAQNGQIDLGQFSLDNVDEIALYNGQKSAIFQTAGDFAAASSVYIRTRHPVFAEGKRQNWKARVKYGASDLLRLSALYEQQLADSLCLSLNAEFLTASGKYRFRYHRNNPDGTIAWDTTAIRQNGDIHAERAEANLHGVMARGKWMLKGYLYHSQRGIPGAIVNNVWRRGERQGDLNTFVQGQWQRSIGNVFSTKWQAKYAFYRTHYINRDSTILPVDNLYRQQEAFFSTANVVELQPNWSASVAYDLRWNRLNSDAYRVGGHLQSPTRFTHAFSLATAIDYRRLKAQASVVETWVNDRTGGDGRQKDAHSLTRLTPALFVSLYPLRQPSALCLRTFVKRSFRMPTFNDLYYTELGNASLRPETATQFDVGIVTAKDFERGFISRFSLQADLYYNNVRDKIIAYPKGQQFRWTMLNLGKVDIKGLDVVAEASGRLFHDVTATLRAQYTWQRAVDITDERKPFYKNQIPYIPRHSGTAIVGLQWRELTLNYSFLYTGERWNEQENTAFNHVQPWYTSDLSASYKLRMKKVETRLTAEVNNLFNQQYDVITNYPMPGRNAALTLDFRI